jgi:hypothetical protein
MKSWVYKFRYTLSRTLRLQWKSMFSLFFALIGAIFTVSEILNNVFESTFGFDFIRENAVWDAFVLLGACLIIKWKPLNYTCFLENVDTKITLCVGDIFCQKSAWVIPTNTTFDTLMDDEFISIQSVQGQYQEKFYHNALTTLKEKLEHSLNEMPFAEITDSRTTNIKRYPIGTTCKVSNGLQHAYFLAVADINKYGKPENVTFENITSALVSLWQHLNEIGHLETISIPIIGTGRAGVKNASRDKLIQEIIFSFVVAAREMKVTESLVICIHPSDFSQKNLHWDDLCEYLRYTCKYQYRENGNIEGHPESEQVIARFG